MRRGFAHFVVVLSCNASLAGLGVLMLPLAIGALAKGGMGAQALGVVAFMELGGAALTTIAASALLKRTVDPLWLCIAGAVLAAAGNLGSAAVVGFVPGLFALRALVGIGAGLMQAGGLATAARGGDPERIYGYIGMAPCLTALAGFALAPQLMAVTGGVAGLFAFQGVLALALAVLLLSERGRVRAFLSRQTLPAPGAIEAPVAVSASALDLALLVFGVGSSFLLACSDATVWAFVAPIGEGRGISLDAISNVLIVCAIVGCFGPLLAARLGDRFGTLTPLLVGQVAMILLGLVMVITQLPLVFAGALVGRVFAVLFLQPRYNGLFARIDPVGRLVAAAAGFAAVGYAVGPLIGGQVVSIEHNDFLKLGFLGAGAAAASFALTVLLMARWKGDRRVPVVAAEVAAG